MAKCGCAGGSCGCLVISGNGVAVSGSGSAQDPYVISAAAPGLQVQDSSTIDMTVSGDGTALSPYVLRAEFIGDIPTPDWTAASSRTWSGGAVSLADVTKPATIRVSMTGSVTTVTLPTWLSSQSGTITLIISQDVTGGRTWIMPGTSAFGIDVALSTAPSARDVISLFWTGVQWVVVPVAMDVS